MGDPDPEEQPRLRSAPEVLRDPGVAYLAYHQGADPTPRPGAAAELASAAVFLVSLVFVAGNQLRMKVVIIEFKSLLPPDE